MGKYINCETFQVRVNTSWLTTERGLAITEIDNKKFIDPQVEPHHFTSFGPAKPADLRLQLSDTVPPRIEQGVVKQFSIDSEALENIEALEQYKAKRIARGAGSVALVSVVDHIGLSYGLGFRPKSINSYTLGERWAGNPTVNLLFLEEGESITVKHELGSYFSDVHEFKATYTPENEKGLMLKRQPREVPAALE